MFKWFTSGTINTAIEKISDGVIAKMNINEERRNREFTYQLKELEFYKSNYNKDLKDIFDYWFELVRVTHIKNNKNLSDSERKRNQKIYADLMNVDKVSKYKLNTLKYGGVETGRVLALHNLLLQEEYKDKPTATALYLWCVILATLKKEILGQNMDPLDVIRVLVNDYNQNEDSILKAQKYVIKVYKDIYKETPKWLK